MRGVRVLGLVVLAALSAIGATSAVPERMDGSLALRAPLQLISTQGASCPPGSSSTTECFGRRSTGRVAGLGNVVVTYAYAADLGHPSCATGSVRILEYPARLAVAGKGDLQILVAARSDCLAPAAGLSVSQSFTITGGTGAYADASGSGTVSRALSQTDSGAAGRETWSGTLTVPDLEFDVVRPTLSGATSRVVRVPKGTKATRVAFKVVARDDRDGPMVPACAPRSGSRFKIGRTAVTCTATDRSGNTATARFWITVRPRS